MTSLERGEEQLLRAAIIAHMRRGGDAAVLGCSGIREHEGRSYVVLHTPHPAGMSVYRVKTNGVLRSLKRWPAVLNG